MRMFFKIIREITIAPIMAFVMLSVLYWYNPSLLGGLKFYLLPVFFLTILPISAYPLQRFIPKYKNEGREGQRNLAIVMAVLGYILSIISMLIFGATKAMQIIYITYFISGILVLIANKLLKVRASGHAAGATAPIAILIYFTGVKGIYGGFVLALVYWASIKMKRHTFFELIFGSIIAVAALAIAVAI